MGVLSTIFSQFKSIHPLISVCVCLSVCFYATDYFYIISVSFLDLV